ncbi:MAG TPA: hypothetical protein VKT73_06745 [Xanthobacteraceae bacterium]|nr:hypothetical protein [Xanthobacteraceae bacterium]
MGRDKFRPLILTQTLAAAFGVLAVAVSAPAMGQVQREIAITCSNTTSGASWQIKIDYDHKTVDSNPASISDAKISWRDAKDGLNYTLDRKSGNLTVVFASSTGGSFFYHRCKLD